MPRISEEFLQKSGGFWAATGISRNMNANSGCTDSAFEKEDVERMFDEDVSSWQL